MIPLSILPSCLIALAAAGPPSEPGERPEARPPSTAAPPANGLPPSPDGSPQGLGLADPDPRGRQPSPATRLGAAR